MLIPFIIAALVLSLGDIKELKNAKANREIFVYVAFMLAAIALCFWFTVSGLNHSISDMLMALFDIRG